MEFGDSVPQGWDGRFGDPRVKAYRDTVLRKGGNASLRVEPNGGNGQVFQMVENASGKKIKLVGFDAWPMVVAGHDSIPVDPTNTVEKNLKTGETKHVEHDLPGCATDVITGFYYLQSLPLQVGSSYEFPISDGKTTIVRATVEKREQVKAPAGNFSAVLVTAQAISGPLQGKGKVWVWYSDDASHIPVQMRAKLGWGTLLFRLQRIDR